MIFKYFLQRIVYLCLITFVEIETLDGELKGFDDSVLFRINWPGKDGISSKTFDLLEIRHMTVTTENDEQYRCFIPKMAEKEKDVYDNYFGPNPLDLLAPLFYQPFCSYRLEAYWTYELCHGKFIRQYHEEREGKKVKIQEYYLGRWDKKQLEELRGEILGEMLGTSDHVPIKKIDGLNMPYIQLNMSDGTICDLNSKPRLTRVLYVCYIHGNNELYSLKETSICEYEAIVLTPYLCEHPRYRSQESVENVIHCRPLGNAPKKPKSLLQIEAENLKMRQHPKVNDEKMPSIVAVKSVDKVPGQEGPRVKVEINPVEDGEELESHVPPPINFVRDSGTSVDSNYLRNFLSGSDCLQGDAGWWNYEFCYGKRVTQYHVEKDASKTVVNLGNFIKSAHVEWLKANPHKLPEASGVRKHISHFYSGGDTCDKTGKPRQTEVKLKCYDDNASGLGSVALYLIEPKTCQYILVVESHIICHILKKVDEYGLYEYEDTGFSPADYENGYTPYKNDESTPGIKNNDKRKEDLKKVVLLHEGDELDNHIPDGDE